MTEIEKANALFDALDEIGVVYHFTVGGGDRIELYLHSDDRPKHVKDRTIIYLNPDGTFTVDSEVPGARKPEPFGNGRALDEGWDMFDVGGRWQLQRIDCPSDHGDLLDYDQPKFASDAAALVHVAQRAAEGSDFHWRALDLIGTLVED